jgi:hypothetical protein
MRAGARINTEGFDEPTIFTFSFQLEQKNSQESTQDE